MVNTAQEFELLKWFCEYEEDRKKKSVDDTISLVENQSVPWSKEILERLSQMNIKQADKVLEQHPGYELCLVWQSIKNLLSIFNGNANNLENSLEGFDRKAQSNDFFSRARQKELEQECHQINNNIYNLASASEALWQLTQRFKGKFNPEKYTDHYDQCYLNSEIYHFIKNLRNALHHRHFVEAHYQIRKIGGANEIKFFFRSDELLRIDCFKEEARKYISATGGKVFVRSVFDKHKKNVTKFYEWVNARLEVDQYFTDYQRCKLVPIKAGRRVWFSIMLQQVEGRNLDLYDYLDQNFTDEELTEIRKLPHRSKAQVDRIIGFYDEKNACTSDMREKIYKRFNVI